MTTPVPNKSLERIIVAVAAGLFLFLFRTGAYDGDAITMINQFSENTVAYNPNHLLLAPLGYIFFLFGQMLHLSPVVMFKSASALSAIVSLLLFREILSKLDETRPFLRLTYCLALLFSSNFLSMAFSEYFLMIQMPFILIPLLIGVKVLKKDGGVFSAMQYVVISFCLAVSCLILISNVFFLFFFAIATFIAWDADIRKRLSASMSIMVLSTLFALLVIVAMHTVSGNESNLFKWLTTYSGQESTVSGLYGIRFTPKEILVSLSRGGFVLLFSNLLFTGQVGKYLQTVIFHHPVDFTLDRVNLIVTIGVMCLALSVLCVLLVWLVRAGFRNKIARFCTIAVCGYGVFNIYWNDSSDQFWFQMLPSIWILFYLFQTRGEERTHRPDVNGNWMCSLPVFLAILLVGFNFTYQVWPATTMSIAGKRHDFEQIMRNADVLVAPGWSMGVGEISQDVTYESISLMSMALKQNPNGEIKDLPTIIRDRLGQGKRVVVGRVFDLDGNPRPWDELRALNVTRDAVVHLLAPFETEKIGTVGGAVYRLIRIRK